MQNLLYRELSVSRTLMDHTKLKLYSYIGIGKYLGCVKIFPIEGVRGAGPLNVTIGPLCFLGNYYVYIYRARKLKLKTQLDA